jgi:hypothetical protein
LSLTFKYLPEHDCGDFFFNGKADLQLSNDAGILFRNVKKTLRMGDENDLIIDKIMR